MVYSCRLFNPDPKSYPFRRQVEVVHHALRSLMGLKEGEEAHHDVQGGGGGEGRGR